MTEQIDFARHNDEVKAVWAAFHRGRPIRVPMVLGINARFILLNEALNTAGVTFQQYFDSPEVMLAVQFRLRDYIHHHLPHDIEMGLPESGWEVQVDFQNCYDAAWFGAPIAFPPGQCPDTRRIYTDDARKWELLEQAPPGPFDGFMGRVREFYEYFVDQMNRGATYKGRPIGKVRCEFPLTGDGPFGAACQLRGAEGFCLDMCIDPGYAHQVLIMITDAFIARASAWRQYLGRPSKEDGLFCLADDFIQLLSLEHYREFVLPHHRRMYEAFSDAPNRGIHLCGDATRHFSTIHEELGVNTFDTGFPVDYARLRELLGPMTTIQGGPHIELLLHGSAEQIHERTCQILQSGVMHGGKFILREGNNLAPKTPLANIETMYAAVKEHGKYQGT